MKLVTAAEMRALERAAVEAGSSEAQLMEEAGLAAAQEAWMLLGTLEGRRIVVLAGPGNNGGDGLVAARHLHDWGAETAVVAPRGREPDDNRRELETRGVAVAEGAEAVAGLRGETADLVIDALLGTGRSRPLAADEPLGAALEALAGLRARPRPPALLALDLPSGLDADGGGADPLTVAADATVAFGAPKAGMYQAGGSAVAGRVQVVDIGIPDEALETAALELITSRWARETLPLRAEDGHKGAFGSVLVVGGSARYRGAPALAALGAVRAGAGLAAIACPEPIIPSIAPALAEAVWLPQAAGADGALTGEAAIALRREWAAFDAAAVGPGLGRTGETGALVWALLPDAEEELGGRVAIDADALNALAEMDDGPARAPAGAALTPHPGEMARLLGTGVAEVQANRVGAAREAAGRFGCAVALKGAHTVVAEPGGRARVSPFANPLLAAAGSGDVLAGMIAAWLARGLGAFDAASLGVYLHAAAGEALRAEYGDGGLRASEIAERLPGVARGIAAPAGSAAV